MTITAGTTTPTSHWTGWPHPDHLAEGSVVTMGVFDGFHRGHQALVARTRRRAAALGVPSVLLTFDPHPLLVTCPERAPRPLLSVHERVAAATALGIDAVVVLPFDEVTAATSAEAFVHDGLVAHLHPRHVVIGANFRFGHRGSGDPAFLTHAGSLGGFGVDVVPLLTTEGRTCSSTAVRSALAEGDVATARQLLGRSTSRVLGS